MSLSAGEDIGSRSLSGVLAAAWRLDVGGCRSLTRHERPLSYGMAALQSTALRQPQPQGP